jgi:type VI secretion system secreted protein VgrG
MEIVTPLGDGVLLFHQMSAREEMSRLFEYRLQLLSSKEDVNLDEILGKNVTIKLGLAEDETRFFNGYVTRFALGGMHGRYHRYIATVRPWLWFLTRTADCRIFQEMTAPDIIKAVFGDHPAADFKLELTGAYRKRTYCVQYRETDFNFVSRLMESEGIGYYFRHTDGHDTMVLTDSTSKHSAADACAKLSFVGPDEQVKPDLEHITAWDCSREIQPGVYVHDDYDLERPSVELRTSRSLPRNYTPSDYEVFDYPGLYQQKADGEHYAAVRIDELGSQFELAQGKTNARGLAVGFLLKLEEHPRADQNREYLVVSAACDLLFENYGSLPDPRPTNYSCAFVAMPASQQFRPRRRTRKPFVQGPQTAFVVGPAGEEIFTDELGRVRVQFHWDRRGKNDQHSSCWIRVSQYWAGKGWGSIHIPRIGHEVIVDFLEGDPDQPIVVGRVYNGTNVPPYSLPDNKTQSGVKSRSSLQGTPDNFNEIRFEDKKGEEEINVHAERNLSTSVEADESRSVGHDRSTTIDHDDVLTVKHDRKIIVKEGNETHVIEKGQRSTNVKLLDKLDAKDIEHHATGHVHVIGDGYVSVVSGQNGMQVYPGFVAVGTDQMANSTKYDGGGILVHGVPKVTIEAGGSKIEIDGSGIKISSSAPVEVTGSMIKLN